MYIIDTEKIRSENVPAKQEVALRSPSRRPTVLGGHWSKQRALCRSPLQTAPPTWSRDGQGYDALAPNLRLSVCLLRLEERKNELGAVQSVRRREAMLVLVQAAVVLPSNFLIVLDGLLLGCSAPA